MCGIVGFTKRAKSNPLSNHQRITNMVHSLSHRGPDFQSVWEDDVVSLGHARLSIIDLSESANQPMHSNDNRYVIIYNGELYNYKELKLELQRVPQGAKDQLYFFKTNSDTEVILASYLRWGVNCLEKFNGMFAFAIYDKQEHTLFIARDRLGIKPLYYYHNENQFIFGSEIRSLLASEMVPRKLNQKAINDYFLYQTVHAPHTIIEGLQMLMPGTFVTIKNNDLKTYRYWIAGDSIKSEDNLSYDSVCKKTAELLYQSVERRLVADVPFGAFLSGGIDSSAVVGMMSRLSSRKVETFNVSFDESEFSEAKYARKISELFSTHHHEIRLTPNEFLLQLPMALKAMDHPSGDGPNTFVVANATKKAGISMALSGLGGDELFAGYDVFTRMLEVEKKAYLNILPAWMRKLPGHLMQLKNNSIAGDKLQEALSQMYFNIQSVYPISRKVFSIRQESSLLHLKDPKINQVFNNVKVVDHNHLLSYVSQLEMSTYMQNVLLRDTDQMSMAVALEVRVPFLDFKLVEHVLSVKDDFKYPHFPKKLLVDSLNDLLPTEIINRPKMGFTLPWEKWMKNDLLSFCELNLNNLAQREFVKEEGIKKLWDGFLKSDQRSSWSRIWHLVVLENWLTENQIE